MLEELCIRRRAGRNFEPGSVLKNRWTILSQLSQYGDHVSNGGSNRGIRLVQERPTGQLCILKMLQPEMLCPGRAARELRKFRDLGQSSGGGHANVVRLLDAYDGSKHPHDIPWIVTELCDRGTLAQLIAVYAEEGLYLPEAFLWHVFESLAEAVRYCHSHGVVHRDISLENIFIRSRTGRNTYPHIQLGDFGSAMTGDDIADDPMGQQFPGSPGFMPPGGYNIDPACDIYQAGLVITCLCMCEMDPMESLADFLSEAGTRDWRSSQDLRTLVRWCLAGRAEERPNAEILLKKIQALKGEGQCHSSLPYEELIEAQKEQGYDTDSSG